jgi:hypothetical protein
MIIQNFKDLFKQKIKLNPFAKYAEQTIATESFMICDNAIIKDACRTCESSFNFAEITLRISLDPGNENYIGKAIFNAKNNKIALIAITDKSQVYSIYK